MSTSHANSAFFLAGAEDNVTRLNDALSRLFSHILTVEGHSPLQAQQWTTAEVERRARLVCEVIGSDGRDAAEKRAFVANILSLKD